jgi:hypothetical protein
MTFKINFFFAYLVEEPPTYNFIKIASITFQINNVTQNGIARV